MCEVHIKLRKPIRIAKVFWPILRMDHWVQYLVAHKPGILLAGHSLQGNWRQVFETFWAKYKVIDPNHPIYAQKLDVQGCIPIMFHGDEGRGHLKRPYLVIAWQPVVGFCGLSAVNDTSFLGINLCSFRLMGCNCRYIYISCFRFNP